MKKSKLFIGVLFVALLGLVFTACEDEDKLGPSITFAGGNYVDEDVTVAPGATIAFSWTAQKGDANMKTITIDRDGVALQGWDELDIPSSVNDTYIDEAEFTVPLNEGNYVYKITITDNNGESVSASFTITVEGSASGDPIDEFTAVLMGAQSNNDLGSYLDIDANSVMKQAVASANQASVDLVYYYGSTNLATLTAPDDPTVDGYTANSLSLCKDWTTTNATRFGESSVSASEFDDIENDAVISTITGLSATKMTNVAVDDVIAFETVDGKLGLIKVSAITTTSSGTITLDVKIQQ